MEDTGFNLTGLCNSIRINYLELKCTPPFQIKHVSTFLNDHNLILLFCQIFRCNWHYRSRNFEYIIEFSRSGSWLMKAIFNLRYSMRMPPIRHKVMLIKTKIILRKVNSLIPDFFFVCSCCTNEKYVSETNENMFNKSLKVANSSCQSLNNFSVD